MSRSIKKNPVVKDNGKGAKEAKTLANRIVRRKLKDPEFNMGNGSEYQKHTQSWDIHDYVSRWTLEEALQMYRNKTYNEWSYFNSKEFQSKCPTEEKFISWWKKEMIGK